MKLKFLLFVVICRFLVACEVEKVTETPDTYTVVNPLVKNVEYTNEYVADIHSVRFVEIRSKIKSYIDSIQVDEGQSVGAGQLLFVLNFVEFEKGLQKANATYKSAIAELKAAEVELRNVKLLVDKNIVSRSEAEVSNAKVEALQADVEKAKANRELAALNIEFAKIKAPFSGIVNRIPKKIGSLIDEGEMLTSISDNREIFAYFNLSEIEYLDRTREGKDDPATVYLKLVNNELYGQTGKIETIESEFNPETGNIAFRARFPNPDGILKHGSNAKVVIKTPIDNALVIPQKSAYEMQDKVYVYVVNSDGVLKQRNVTIMRRFPHFFVLESGLSKDDKIVYEGVENLKDGQRIIPQKGDLSVLMSDSETELQ